MLLISYMATWNEQRGKFEGISISLFPYYNNIIISIIRKKWYKYVYNSRFNINTTIKRPWWGDARWRCHEWRAAMQRARSTSRCGCVQFGREYLPPPYCFFTDILLRKVRWITFLMEVFKAKLSPFSDNFYIFYCIHKRMGIQLEKLIYKLIFQKYKRDWHSLKMLYSGNAN